MPLTIGLTGGVASGKTATATAFAALGVPVLDADQVAREVVAPGEPALQAIVEAFGPEALQADGTLDRRRMRERVFADDAARGRLERITHPAIRARLVRWRDAQAGPYCLLAVPILIESGMAALVDRILLIDVPEDVQVRRLTARDGIDEALAHRMLAAQAPRERRLARAHDVIRNEGDLAALEAAVHRLHQFYVQAAQHGAPDQGLHLP
ncbi:MAG TPA: dephospho-CoA kinase [Candidatus Binatia bacterium]|nr:dephospho-CoA kinase [Candidatus Binatia bacterium]